MFSLNFEFQILILFPLKIHPLISIIPLSDFKYLSLEILSTEQLRSSCRTKIERVSWDAEIASFDLAIGDEPLTRLNPSYPVWTLVRGSPYGCQLTKICVWRKN